MSNSNEGYGLQRPSPLMPSVSRSLTIGGSGPSLPSNSTPSQPLNNGEVMRVSIPSTQKQKPEEEYQNPPRTSHTLFRTTSHWYGSDGGRRERQAGARDNLGVPGLDVLGTATTPGAARSLPSPSFGQTAL